MLHSMTIKTIVKVTTQGQGHTQGHPRSISTKYVVFYKQHAMMTEIGHMNRH